MSLAARDRLTFDEFLAIEHELPPFAQLIDGEVVVTSPSRRHQTVAARMFEQFVLFTQGDRRHGFMGWAGIVNGGRNDAFIPDIWWFPTEDAVAADAGHANVFRDPPGIVIEVRSPSTWHLDRGHKLHRYEAKGVAEVWLVDGTDDEVTVHRRSEGSDRFDLVEVLRPGATLTTPLVPGWAIDLSALLAR